MEVSFGSTYRIPISEAGINKAKKMRLRGFIIQEGGLAPASSCGACRISIPQEKDASFEQELRRIGYKVWQKFSGEGAHGIPNQPVGKNDNKIDIFIRKALGEYDYTMKGKNRPQKKKAVN